jgi:hypothetical protein
MREGLSFRATAVAAIAYAVAMAYVEAAVVVYLERALGAEVGQVFPIRPVTQAGDLAAIEVGREVATLAMIAAVGALAGRSPLERLAWAAVVGAGLAAARMLRAGRTLPVKPIHWVAALGGGLLMVLSYTADAATVIDGGLPGPYPWPVFVAGMALALWAAVDVLRRGT